VPEHDETGASDEEVLAGGVANAGEVVRFGDQVLRPANPRSASVHAFLAGLRAEGFDGVPRPIAVDANRERLEYIPGAVAVPPFPVWVQDDDCLVSTAQLIAAFHRASAAYDPSVSEWSNEMADPRGGSIVCHNDICWENVVFRDGHAIALLDFDFAAPGRVVYDVAQFARMCVPVDDDLSAKRVGWVPADRPRRVRLVCDAYGLDEAGRYELLSALDDAIARGGEFVVRHVEAGEPGFVAMWQQMGGMERFDRRRRWWAERRGDFAAALR
jgi:hypothetical protein